jgi:hypothetical protein
MKRKFIVWLLTSHLLLLSQAPVVLAQTAGEVTFVTFTFTSPCEGCATQNSEAGHVYIVDVPSAKTPSLAKSQSLQDFNLQVTIKNDRMVYSFSFKPGTSPRAVWQQGATVLQVFFVPGAKNLAATTSETGSSSLGSTTDAIPGSSKGNGNGHGNGNGNVGNGSAGIAPAASMSSPTAVAQGPSLKPDPKPIDRDDPRSTAFTSVDMSVPASPAFTVLGVTPETVIRPTSPRAFATSLLNGVDQNGNFQSGLAMDFVPYLLVAGDDLTLNKYQHNRIVRLLSRTQLSFATAKGATEDDKSLRVGLGLHMTLWDRGDPRLDETLIKCLGDFVLPVVTNVNDTEGNARNREAAKELNDSISTRCRQQAHERNWAASSWIIGAAPSWISTDGQTKNLGWNGGGFWTSLAYGFEGVPGLEKKSQLILHARYRNREEVPDPDVTGAFLSQDSMFFGARFRTGSPTFNGSFEYTFLRSRFAGLKYDSSSRLAVLFERRIAGDTWFNLSLGGETGRQDGRNNGFVLTSFKWAFSDRRDRTPPP